MSSYKPRLSQGTGEFNPKRLKLKIMLASSIKAELEGIANPAKAKDLQRFFKTGPGEYGEGDIFLGIQVPFIRDVIKKYKGTPLEEIIKLLKDPAHEVRMSGGLLMVEYYKKASPSARKDCYESYVRNADCFNNWDLVDLTCPNIVGAWLWDKDRSLLYDFSRSENLWKQRISIISTLYFIRKDDFSDTFKIADILLNHQHDLIHKAVGWMLREAGKRNHDAERSYLLEDEKYLSMPRTMLRYAIEKFPEPERQYFLKK